MELQFKNNMWLMMCSKKQNLILHLQEGQNHLKHLELDKKPNKNKLLARLVKIKF